MATFPRNAGPVSIGKLLDMPEVVPPSIVTSNSVDLKDFGQKMKMILCIIFVRSSFFDKSISFFG